MARCAVRSGRTPNCRPLRIWGGAGSGARCAVCGSAVESADVEIEAEFGSDEEPHRFHVRCFSLWERACENGAPRPSAPQPARPSEPGTARPERSSDATFGAWPGASGHEAFR